jgi:DNA processing protein
VPGNVTNSNSFGPNTLIKQGAKLTATWEDVWEELPNDVRAKLEADRPSATEVGATASLFQTEAVPPHERKLLALLKDDESTQIDDIVERLEGQMSSSEIFSALFELELAGKVRQMQGKNLVKAF